MLKNQSQDAEQLAFDIARAAGIGECYGDCILPELHNSLGAIADLCRGHQAGSSVDVSLFASLMDMARQETGRMLLRERLGEAHRDLLMAAIDAAALRIVQAERKPGVKFASAP